PFPAANIGFHQGTPVAPRRFLPTHAAMFGNRLQMPVTRSGRILGRLARHRTRPRWHDEDRKSTRLNSSQLVSSYAVFCLKKKKRLENLRYCTIFKSLLEIAVNQRILRLLL